MKQAGAPRRVKRYFWYNRAMVDPTSLSYRFIHGLLTRLPGSGGGNVALGLVVLILGAHLLQLPLLLKFRKSILTQRDSFVLQMGLAVAFTELVPLAWAIVSAPIWFSGMEWPGWMAGGVGIGSALLLAGTLPLVVYISLVFPKRHFHRRTFEERLREFDEAAVRQQMGAGWQKVEQALAEARALEGGAVAAGKPFDQAAAGAYRRANGLLSVTTPPSGPLLKLTRDLSIPFVPIPAGQFMMGSRDQEEGRSNCDTLRAMTLQAFHMSTTTVTEEQYEAVMGRIPGYGLGATWPVANVSWKVAQAFCKKLSWKTGLNVRLPTEAEWEYACRAGTTTPFNTGQTISTDQANYHGEYVYGNGVKGLYLGEAVEVGSFKPNAWGLYDMHGNVWEWCFDVRGGYPAATVLDRTEGVRLLGLTGVRRGGSYICDPRWCRSAYRGTKWSAAGGNFDTGFRLALDFP